MTELNPQSTPDPANYHAQLREKIDALNASFADFELPSLEVFESPPLHYRLRCEFKVWHQDGQAHYAMYHPGEHKKPYVVEHFPVASIPITQRMQPLMTAINGSENLRRRLFSVEFLSGLCGEVLITLLYHRPLDEVWEAQARTLAATVEASIVGRSRKQKRVVGRDYIRDTLRVNQRDYRYRQMETAFTQPNGRVNEQMLGWAANKSREFGGDLLELYCGNGNFTLPLAQNFDRVLATEIAKLSVRSALHNLAENEVNNVELVRMSSEEISQALARVRPFRRLKEIDLDSYRFSTVFVDPPRAGLDDQTLMLLRQFDNIIYISCNPATLRKNLGELAADYRIEHFAVFDQFPYTPHLECGAILKKSDPPVAHGRNQFFSS